MIKLTEIVLVLFSVTACTLAIMKILDAAQFMAALLLVLGFYYKDKSDQAVAEAIAAAKVG